MRKTRTKEALRQQETGAQRPREVSQAAAADTTTACLTHAHTCAAVTSARGGRRRRPPGGRPPQTRASRGIAGKQRPFCRRQRHPAHQHGAFYEIHGLRRPFKGAPEGSTIVGGRAIVTGPCHRNRTTGFAARLRRARVSGRRGDGGHWEPPVPRNR